MSFQGSNKTTNLKCRTRKGTTLAELPMMLWFIFVLMLMPMLSISTLTLRSALMNAVVQNAAQSAAKAKTFSTGTAKRPSALQAATQVIIASVRQFPGLTVGSVNCVILTTPVLAGGVSRSSTRLAAPADSSRNIYQIETVVVGRVEPLIKMSPTLFGVIPGVTAPLLVTYMGRAMSENPQGLNQ